MSNLVGLGNVGIGTTTPQQLLDVNGNVNVAGTIVAGTGTMFRNRIINGDMRLDQTRLGSNAIAGNVAASSANIAQSLDRFQLATGSASGTLSAKQVTLTAADQLAIGNISAKAVAISPSVQPDITFGLTTQVTFDGSNAVDTLGGISGPTWVGTPAYTTGKIGSTALNLTANPTNAGTATTLVNYALASYTPTSTTVSMWLYPGANNGTNTQYLPMSTSSSTTSWYSSVELVLSYVSSTSYGVMVQTTNNNGASWIFAPSGTVSSQPVVNANTWYHVAFTLLYGGNMILYINGVASTPVSYSTAGSAFTLITLGCRSATNNLCYNGYIDDFRIYNRALSPQDITALYNYNATTIPLQVTSSLSTGLVANVTFEGGSVQDVLGGMTNPVWTGTPAFTTGKVGSTALNLSANPVASTINTCVDYSVTIPSAFTCTLWINPTSVGSGSTPYIICFGGSNSPAYSLNIGLNSTGIYVDVWLSGANGTNAQTCYGNSASYVPANAWSHVAVTISATPSSSGANTLYVNGVFASSTVTSSGYITQASSGTATTKVRLGGYLGGGASYSGYIDDFRIYNRVLSSSEIAQLAGNTPVVPIPNSLAVPAAQTLNTGLVSYYPFESVAAPTSGLTTNLTFDSTTADAQGALPAPTVTGTAFSTTLQKVGTGCLDLTANSVGANSFGATALLSYNYSLSVPCTVAAWIYPSNAAPGSGLYQIPICFGASVLGFEFVINPSGQVYIDVNMNTGNNTTSGSLSTSGISSSKWSHLCATLTPNGTAYLYINGVQVATTTCSGTALTNNGTFTIGRDVAGNWAYKGLVDDLRIYNRVLSANEVAQLGGYTYDYQATLPVTTLTSGLTTLVTFEGSSAQDTLGNMTSPTWTGTAAYTTGKVGSTALDLSANTSPGSTPSTYVTYAAAAPSLPFTTSVWFYSKSSASSPSCVWGFAGASWAHSLVLYNGQMYSDLTIGTVGSSASGNLQIANSAATAVSINTWVHVAITVDLVSQTQSMYINGVLAKSVTNLPTSGVMVSSASPYGAITQLRFGTRGDMAANAWQGYIDDFRIYNRVLTTNEIAALAGYASPLSMVGTAQYVSGRIGTQALYLANEANVTAVSLSSNYAQFSNYNVSTVTVSSWVYITQVPNSGVSSCIWVFGSSSEVLQLMLYSRSSTQTFFYPWAGAGDWPTIPATTGTWYHTAAVFVGGSTFALYVNGLLAVNYTSGVNAAASGQTFRLGCNSITNVNGNRPFAGYIDDLRIYSRALSASEIAALFYAGQSTAYTLYQQPIEAQTITDLAWGTSNAQSASISAWIKNNTPAAQQFAMALNTNPAGLITWIPFENGSAVDVMGFLSPPAVTGTLSLSSTIYKIGSSALNLTANTPQGTATASVYYSLTAPPLMNNTYSFWFNPSSMTAAQMIFTLGAGLNSGSNTAFSLQFYIASSTSIQIDIYSGSSGYAYAITVPTMTTGTWYHLVVAISAGMPSLSYFNGVLVGTGPTVSATATYTCVGSTIPVTTLRLGCQPSGLYAFQGYIDDVRIYNSVLTQAQVYQLYINNANSTALSSYLIPRSLVYNTPSIPSATWQKVAFTVPGDAVGSYATDTSKSLTLSLCLGAGSTVSTSNVAFASNNAASVWQNGIYYTGSNIQTFASSSNNFLTNPFNSVLLTGVQLEKGSAITPFEYRHYGAETSLANTNILANYQSTYVGNNAGAGFYIPRALQSLNKVVYTYTGADQTFIVPPGVTMIFAKMWGAGGAAGNIGGWSSGSPGGAGGFTVGVLAVTPGQQLTVMVGGGGVQYGTSYAYGGGGALYNNGDNRYCGAGGGRSAIRYQSSDLMTAGGGGGGGSQSVQTGVNGWGCGGGAGGGLQGQNGMCLYPISSQNTYAAGAGGSQTMNDFNFSSGGVLLSSQGGNNNSGSTSGSQYQGGTGGISGTYPYSGAGGGGYYGGGGGQYGAVSAVMPGGGGGSGYVGGCVTGQTVTGLNWTPPATNDVDYVAGIATGGPGGSSTTGAGNVAANPVYAGGNGRVVVYY